VRRDSLQVTFCLLSLAFSVSACTSLVQKGATPPLPPKAAYYHAIVGMKQEAENPAAALLTYQAALKDDPDAPFLLRRVATLLARSQRTSEAMAYVKRALLRDPNDIATLSLLANLQAVSQEIDAAIETYERVLNLSPKDIHPYLTLAQLYGMRGRGDAAEAVLSAGIAAHPDSPQAHSLLAGIAAERKAWEKAAEHYLRALDLDPSLHSVRLGLAQVYEQQDKPAEAEENYRALVNTPKQPEALSGLLRLLDRGNRLDEGLALLEKLQKVSPSDETLRLQTAMVWAKKKDYPRAIEVLLPAATAHPDDTRMQVYLASLYEETAAFDKAIALYEAAIQRERHPYGLRLRLGALYADRLKQTDRALAEGDAALALDSARPDAYLFKGTVLVEAERYEEAVQVFSDGIAKNRETADLWFHLGVAYDKLNRFDDFVAAMQSTIDLDAQHAVALNYLGYTYADRGIRLDEAIDLIQRALAIQPDEGYIVDSLGWAYYKMGRLNEAIITLQRAVALAPEDAAIHEHLGDVYLHLDPERAKAAWQQALRLDPTNAKLAAKFKTAGFGDPKISE